MFMQQAEITTNINNFMPSFAFFPYSLSISLEITIRWISDVPS